MRAEHRKPRPVRRKRAAPKYSGSAHQQLKRAGLVTKKGAVRYRPAPKTAPRVIVKTAGGKTKVVSRKTARREFAKARKTEKARKTYARSLGYKSLREYASAEVAKPYEAKGPRVAGLDTADLKRFAERDTLFGAAAPGFAKLGVASARIGTAPYHVAKAFKESPGKTSKATAKSARDIILGLPSAAVQSVTDPKGAASETLKDIGRRYGPLIEGDGKKFRERIKKEGAAVELLELGGGGAISGRVAGQALKASKRGRKLMEAPRPKLRTTGGAPRTQKVSPNAYVAVAQRGLDKARAKNTQRLTKNDRAPALDRTVAEGEVVPLRRVRKQRLAVAGRKSRGVAQLKAEQARQVHRGASTNVARLSKDERRAFKYAMQLGIRDPEVARKTLAKRREQIVANRELEGTEIKPALAKTNDEIPVIDRLLEAPEKAFTPRLKEVADQERKRGLQIQKADPGLDTRQMLLRRYAPVAEHLGVKRRGKEPDAKAAYERMDEINRGMGAFDFEISPERRPDLYGEPVKLKGGGHAMPRNDKPAPRVVSEPGEFPMVQDFRRGKMAARGEPTGPPRPLEFVYRAVSEEEYQKALRQGYLKSDGRMNLSADEGTVAATSDPSVYLPGKLASTKPGDHPGRILKIRVRPEHGWTVGTDGYIKTQKPIPIKMVKDVSPRIVVTKGEKGRISHRIDEAPESDAQFIRRVKKAAEKEGLDKPAYVRSQKRPQIRFSDYALGGTKAVAEDRAYTGALFRTGREDVRPEVHSESLARNIKRKHNWNAIADNFDTHTFDWGKNKSISQILDDLDTRGIDPGDVAFWNPRKFREVRKELGDTNETPGADDISPPGLKEAVDEAAVDIQALSTKGEDFKNTSGWSVVPKAVYDEIHADTRPSGKAGRGFDVVKTKQSRVLLGTNPPWLAFQVGSNALLTTLAKTGLVDAVKAQLWWRKLDPKLKEAVEPYVGLGPFQGDIAQPKMGASTNSRLVNAYRAFKQTPLSRRASKLNPLDALFRADNAQNNFFRRSVLYSQTKRDAYKRMGENVGKAAEMQERLHGILTLGPKQQMEAVLRNREQIEAHAQYVNDMLGDYTTYTAKERRTLGRAVMFYGFLRFSLNFTFHTMPTKHPIMTALIGNLSQLKTEEVRELLGGDELPFALGRIYTKKDGKLEVVDLARLNPASNVLVDATSAEDLGKLMGALPPIVSTAFDIAYGKSSFKRKALRVKGETGYGTYDRETKGISIGREENARIALDRMLTLAFPYRAAKKVKARSVPQGDDSLLWDMRPTVFSDKRPDIKKSIAKKEREFDTGEAIKAQLLPFLPKPSTDLEFAESIRERRDGKKKVKKKSGGGLWSGGGDSPRGVLWR